jgi:hypothetical protein
MFLDSGDCEMIELTEKLKSVVYETEQNAFMGASQTAPPPGLQPILLIKQSILL